MMSTSESFSKAIEHDVLVSTSMFTAYLPDSFRSSRLLMWACSKSKMASASAIPLARFMVASIGFYPIDVSWDKMKASVPSRVAVDTSVNSVLSGWVWVTMLSTICDYIMTNLAFLLHCWMAHFCAIIIFSAGSSNWSSFLWIMIPSDYSKMSSKFSMPWMVSTFANILMFFPNSPRVSLTFLIS